MRAALCLALCLLCSAQTTFHADVHLVNVSFSVRDQQGKLVPDLQQDDFEVLEDGVPQKIAFFSRSADLPLSLGLVVDVSGSQQTFIKSHNRDLETFLKTTLGKNDRAFLLCFGNRLRLLQDFSSSPTELAGALGEVTHERPAMLYLGRASGRKVKAKADETGYPELGPPERRLAGTAFYDSIYYSITEKLAEVERGRRALIIYSDGEDNSSAHHMLDAIEAAQANNVVLFCIRYTDDRRPNARNKYGTSVMARIAKETGGAEFDAREKGLKDNFRQIGEQLRSAYELAYHSTNPASDGTFHKIVIRAKRPELAVRTKTGYYSR